MEPQLKILRETVCQNQLDANVRTAALYNSKRITKQPSFAVSDRVWLWDPRTAGPKLAHKVAKNWRGPFLILEANPEYHVYKLQDCTTQRPWRSWVHSDRLRLYDSSRDHFYSRNVTVSTTSGSPDATPDATQEVGTDGNVDENLSAVTPPFSQQHILTDASKTSADGEANVSSRSSNSDVSAPIEWHSIRAVHAHRRRGNALSYRVEWLDGSESWVPARDVTDVATDHYWLHKSQHTKQRRRCRRRE